MTELRTLRWGHEPGLSACAQYKHKYPYNSKAGESETENGGERRRWKQKPRGERLEDVVLLALKMEERAVSQGVQVPPEAGKGKNRNSTLEPPEGTQSCKHLDSNPVRTILRL